ncbi:acyl-CoA dehydrogenase family protein [Chloroflexota bacterium]
MYFNLNEQEKMLQKRVKEFAIEKVQPRAAEIDRSGQFPFDLAHTARRKLCQYNGCIGMLILQRYL